METTEKFKLLDCIGKLYENSENCKLEESFFVENDTELSMLSDYFGVSKTQSFFIMMVFTMNLKGDTVDFNDLNKHFDCNPLRLIEYVDDFKFLEDKGIFIKSKLSRRQRGKVSFANDQFTVNEKISEAIMSNQPIPKVETEIKHIFELLEKIYNSIIKREEDEMITLHLIVVSEMLLETYSEFQLVKAIKKYQLETEDILLYMYVIWKSILGRESCDLETALEKIFSNAPDRISYLQRMIDKENLLIQNKLLEILPAAFYSNSDIRLTKASNQILKDCNISVFSKTKDKDNIITPETIATRKLIFSPSEMKQLYVLKDVLQPVEFLQIQKRLEEKNLPKGIAALLHGEPGTGKTEVVRQMARETNRDIMKVDISQSKSMWFGESEKVVKKIFTDYKSFMQDSDITPILFLNEADALISKRGDIGSSNTRQTENAIQNILLEELENFEGILIATTNLANNLDSAFERRFLFKILFNQPSSSIRAEIWKIKLPSLSLEDCNFLAEKFNFSGGQIDNIIRKSEINEIIHDEVVSLENLLVFCSEETLNQNHNEIGFTKSYNHV